MAGLTALVAVLVAGTGWDLAAQDGSFEWSAPMRSGQVLEVRRGRRDQDGYVE
jgi:hypothetical protein